MNRVAAVMIAVLIAAALGAGYWLGARKSPPTAMTGDAAKTSERTILYYRNPMGLPDTSPVPKKDPMGMDYVPVYEGDEPTAAGPLVKISLDKVQKLGVRTEAAAPRVLTRTVRAVGMIQASERGLYTVAPKFEGWIQKLHVNTTGQAVRKGEPLMDIYSPDLITAQQEYLIAVKGMQSVKNSSPEVQASMRQLMESALQRLRNWDIAESDLKQLQTDGKTRQYLTLRSRASGVVLEKPAVEGKRFMPGEMLYQIADLSSVWLLVEVFEQDLGLVRAGQAAKIRVDAYPDKTFTGTVTFVYPTVTPETRTTKVRIEQSNTGGLLKPAMYAHVELAATHSDTQSLAVPDSAVLDTGARQLVLVQRGEGTFEPRTMKLGMRADDYVEVLEGGKAGENVVVSANFLIDAESNLKAAIGGMAMGVSKPATPKDGAPAAPLSPPEMSGKGMGDSPTPPTKEEAPGTTQHKGR